MTREEAKKMLPIMQAFAEGKMIEIFNNREWNDLIIESPKFDCKPSCYRIKPEPKYRPFRTRRECWDEMLKHQPFGWLKSIKTARKVQISRVFELDNYVLITLTINDGFAYSSNCVFNEYIFDDGTPFGIRVE